MMFATPKPRKLSPLEDVVRKIAKQALHGIHTNNDEWLAENFPVQGVYTSPDASEDCYYSVARKHDECEISVQIPLGIRGNVTGRPRLVVTTNAKVHAISPGVTTDIANTAGFKRTVKNFQWKKKLVPAACMKDIIEFPRVNAGFHQHSEDFHKVFIVRT
ncbi:hypothetical protein O4G76_14830 [Limimaricola sp. G21655-S1]|uniref:hypothetical protein n=1 Tax=Limimaricola sp. G21655-S1 TaxID=3014768 RepID=UPI0022AE8832|nr:hypothetical protein [Limimaricola sp. G21655-S1]MCZ4262118.1 hypothetical protein [Limimaricola sp. G21655-S1]